MPLKATQALLGPDGTIYCNRGTVLPDDDPVAVRRPNQVVGSTEPITEGYGTQAEARPPAPPKPEPEAAEPEALMEQNDDEFLAEPEDEEEEPDEGVDL